MAYTKPQLIAQNNAAGSYAAGCPANQNATGAGRNPDSSWGKEQCKNCERTA